jgi:hypothetical protein
MKFKKLALVGMVCLPLLSLGEDLATLREKAEHGDQHAQYALGSAYAKGEGVLKNGQEAVKWYRKAAEEGNVAAQMRLGLAYGNGEGVPRDAEEAVKWYRKAATEHGERMAQYSLGRAYAKGEGVPQDAEEAAKWYRKAAEQGNRNAQVRLGHAYAKGEGVPKNDQEAEKWSRKAAEQGNAQAKNKPKDDYWDIYFNQCAKTVQNIYSTVQGERSVVKSYRSKDEIKSGRGNYALEFENFLKTTTAPVSPGNGAFVKTKDGLQAEIDKIYSDNKDAVFIKDGTQEKRLLVSDLDLPSQRLAKDLMIFQQFERRFEISVRTLDGRKKSVITENFNGATETAIYKETPYNITLENISDLPIDNLIIEYQVFFRQKVAGASEHSDEHYRFVGYSIVKEVPAKGKSTITVNPPAIMENELRGATYSGTIYSLRYPSGYNQKSSGCMQGYWIRVHRVTPSGCLTREAKEGIYPDNAEWVAVREQYSTNSPFFFF